MKIKGGEEDQIASIRFEIEFIFSWSQDGPTLLAA